MARMGLANKTDLSWIEKRLAHAAHYVLGRDDQNQYKQAEEQNARKVVDKERQTHVVKWEHFGDGEDACIRLVQARRAAWSRSIVLLLYTGSRVARSIARKENKSTAA